MRERDRSIHRETDKKETERQTLNIERNNITIKPVPYMDKRHGI